MSAPITVKIDNVAGAGYIALSSEPVASTTEYSDSVMIDLDALGMVVGIEVLELDGPLPIDEIAQEFHIHSDTARTVRRL